MFPSRMAGLFSSAIALAGLASMKSYGRSNNRGNAWLCSSSNIATAKIKHYFCQISYFDRWPSALAGTEERTVEPFHIQRLSQNVYGGSLSRYKRVTREEENLNYPFFTRISIKYFISY